MSDCLPAALSAHSWSSHAVNAVQNWPRESLFGRVCSKQADEFASQHLAGGAEAPFCSRRFYPPPPELTASKPLATIARVVDRRPQKSKAEREGARRLQRLTQVNGLVAAGFTQCNAARIVNVSTASLWRWRKRLDAG